MRSFNEIEVNSFALHQQQTEEPKNYKTFSHHIDRIPFHYAIYIDKQCSRALIKTDVIDMRLIGHGCMNNTYMLHVQSKTDLSTYRTNSLTLGLCRL